MMSFTTIDRRRVVVQHRESPVKRINPSGRTRWVARYTAPNGRRRSAGTFATRREAQAAIDAACRQPQQPQDTVASYAAEWTRRYPRAPRTDATNQHRLSRVLHVELEGCPLQDWPLAELRRRHAAELAGLLLSDQGRSVSGARNILRVLSALCEDAIRDEIIDSNPFRGVRLRDSDPRAMKQPRQSQLWTFEQVHEFAAAGGRYEPMIRMVADCGLRVGELLALRRDLQDLKGGVFRVDGTAWNGTVVASSREKRHDRMGPIPPGCLASLRTMPVRIDSPWLFPTPGGTRTGRFGRDHPGGLLWRYSNWRATVWLPACELTGIRPTPQEFRSSYNTLLLAAGIDRADLADILGHSEDVNAARYTRALRRSGDIVRSMIG